MFHALKAVITFSCSSKKSASWIPVDYFLSSKWQSSTFSVGLKILCDCYLADKIFLGENVIHYFQCEIMLYALVVGLGHDISCLFKPSNDIWVLDCCVFFFNLSNSLAADEIPTKKAMLLQIYVAMKAMPWYSALPSLSEYMVENGWTKCYSRISDVGWLAYLVYMSIYLVLVEFGIYWMHRELHDIKPLYKHLHATHHIYNKQNTLSPFAGEFSVC